MTLAEQILAEARRYRKEYGWNVIPLCDYSKNPASSPYVKANGWKHLEERTLNEQEFISAFTVPSLTGVGLITGQLSRTVVLDEDSYKKDGMRVSLTSPMMSKTASGGRHIFGKYLSPVRSMGWREGVNVEAKGQGGFIVLPPSQVYRKDENGKQTQIIGTYEWISQCTWEQLPAITEEELKPFREQGGKRSPTLEDFVSAGVGSRHPTLLSVANSIFNKFKQSDWHIAEKIVRDLNRQNPHPKTENEVGVIIRSAKEFVRTHPKIGSQEPEIPAERTPHVEYKNMSDEDLEKVEHREELSTGLAPLDEILPFKTGYYVICGNPGSGKGWFATWLAKQFFIMHGRRSVLFSLEMAESLVRTRLLQQWSQLTQEQLMANAPTVLAKSLMRQNAMAVYPFGQADSAYQTPENFKKDIELFYSQGYRIFFFDHLHELDGANDNTKNQAVVEAWGKMFQTLCKDYKDIWLFIFTQPNGEASGKVCLGRTDIAGSKSITQKCEVFLSLNRRLLPKVGQFEQIANDSSANRDIFFWVDKNRLSPQQKVGRMAYLSKTGNFTEYPDVDVLPDVQVFPPTPSAQQALAEKTEEVVN